MTVQVLGGRVQHDVETQLQWPLYPRTGKGVVGHTENASLATQVRNRGQVGEAQQGIARCLDPDHPRVWLQRRFEGRQVRQVDEAETMTGAALAHPFEQSERTAVQVVAGDHMRTGIEQFEYGGDGRQPGGKGEGPGPAFQVRHTALQRPARGVVRASVVEPLVHPGTLLRIGGVGVDRRHQRPGGRVRHLPGMDHPGGKVTWFDGFIVLAHARDLRK
ncbi:hypothetical protein D3C78_1017580 [compost metagenome]